MKTCKFQTKISQKAERPFLGSSGISPHFMRYIKECTKPLRQPQTHWKMERVMSNFWAWSSAQELFVYTVGKAGQRYHSHREVFLSEKKSVSKYFKITPLMCPLTTSLSQRKFLMPFYSCHYIRHIWLWSWLTAMIWWELASTNTERG